MGEASALAQGLKQIITTASRFYGTDQRVYLKIEGKVSPILYFITEMSGVAQSRQEKPIPSRPSRQYQGNMPSLHFGLLRARISPEARDRKRLIRIHARTRTY